MKKLHPEYFAFLVMCLLSACGQQEPAAIQQLSSQEKMYYEQYMVQGEQLYQAHCANCHQEDGSGLRRLIPPLAGADYMLQDVGRTVCIIRHGAEGTIVVNGVEYNLKMPGNEQLKAIEVAQIVTFIYNSWGNQHGYVPVGEVDSWLNSCRN